MGVFGEICLEIMIQKSNIQLLVALSSETSLSITSHDDARWIGTGTFCEKVHEYTWYRTNCMQMK